METLFRHGTSNNQLLKSIAEPKVTPNHLNNACKNFYEIFDDIELTENGYYKELLSENNKEPQSSEIH